MALMFVGRVRLRDLTASGRATPVPLRRVRASLGTDGQGSELPANDDTITFIVGRWGYWDSSLTVQFFAPAATATADDFVSAMPTSVPIPPGGATATTTFMLTPANDELFEDEESVYAILKASGDYWLSSAFMAAATIGDNDVDLEIDSNNDGVINATDDPIEDTDTNAGKLIVVNRDDNDGDGILDFADGFNAFSDTSDDQSTSGEQFAEVKLRLPPSLDPSATLTFDYDAADPASPTVSRTAIDKPGLDGVTYRTHEYRVGSGLLRLWLKPGDAARTTGDFLADEDPYTLSELGLSAGQRELRLYLEAVNGSAAGAGMVNLIQGTHFTLVATPYSGPREPGNNFHWEAIDIFFSPGFEIGPGHTLVIDKEIFEVFGDANIWMRNEAAIVAEYPTPEPGGISILVLSGLAAACRRRLAH